MFKSPGPTLPKCLKAKGPTLPKTHSTCIIKTKETILSKK